MIEEALDSFRCHGEGEATDPGRRHFAGVAGSVLLAAYSVGAAVYVPHLFSTYTTRYGVIGAVFAMISTLFCVMVTLVGSAAAGPRSTVS